jgi:hypothetical protein
LKHINNGGTTDGGIHMDGQALTGKVIDRQRKRRPHES